MHSIMQRPDPPYLELIIGERISSLCSIGMDTEGKVKELIWMNRKVMRVSDSTFFFGENARTNCSKAGEAAEVLWDGVPEVNHPVGKSIAEFKPNLWNKDKLRAWCKDLGKIYCGIEELCSMLIVLNSVWFS